MSGTPRDELSELVGLLSAHLDWQRELGASGFAASVPAMRAVDAPASGASGAASQPARANAPAPDAPAAAPAPRFERPDFLRGKRPNAPPARTPDERASVTVAPRPAAPAPAPAPVQSAPPAAAVPEPPAATATAPLDAPEPSRDLFGEVEPALTARKPGAAPASQGTNGAPFTTPPLEGQARLHALEVLRDEVAGCTKCRLHSGRTKSVFARGNPFAPIAFVGEGPGRDEDLQGAPFVGAAGQLLDKIIAAMGLDRENDVFVCNVAKCRPPQNRVPLPDEMAACGPYLVTQLDAVRPQLIVALGKTAVSYLLGTTDSMSRLRGKWHQWHGIPLLPTWHPAYLLRTPEAKKDTWDDMKLVLQRLGRQVPRQR